MLADFFPRKRNDLLITTSYKEKTYKNADLRPYRCKLPWNFPLPPSKTVGQEFSFSQSLLGGSPRLRINRKIPPIYVSHEIMA